MPMELGGSNGNCLTAQSSWNSSSKSSLNGKGFLLITAYKNCSYRLCLFSNCLSQLIPDFNSAAKESSWSPEIGKTQEHQGEPSQNTSLFTSHKARGGGEEQS